MENHAPEVLICGAGPVGLTLASQLRRQGGAFRLIDRNAQATSLSKALVVWARSLELLSFSMPVEPLLAAGEPVERIQFRTGEGVLANVSLTNADSPFGTGILLPQAETERLLEEHLTSVGVQVERQTTLDAFTDLGDRVRCTLTLPDGQRETVEAAWLVGCDGAHSTVRKQLGLAFHGDVDLHRWLLVDAYIDGELPAVNLIACWHRLGLLVMFRLRERYWRIVAETPLDDPNQPRRDPTLAEMQNLLDERGPQGLRLSRPDWLSEFRISERKVDRYRVGRVLLAGDAAHIHSPAGGQGMNTGMQDACNLAWKLALVQRGITSDFLLDSYSIERSAVGEQVLKAASRLTQISTLKNPLAQKFRNTFARFAMHFHWTQELARDMLSELTIHYTGSPITGRDERLDSASPRPGQRAADTRLVQLDGQATTLFTELRDPRTLLLTWGGEPGRAAALIAAAPVPWQPYLRGLDLLPLSADSSAADSLASRLCAAADAQRIGLREPSYVVIRPDGYIALAAPLNRPHALLDWLTLLSGSHAAADPAWSELLLAWI